MSKKEIKEENQNPEAVDAKNEATTEANTEDTTSDLNGLTYEELLEQVNIQKEDMLRAVALS